MKSASFPSLRVDPELRQAAESVLRDGESLSNLIEHSVREAIERRRAGEPAEVVGNGAAEPVVVALTPLAPSADLRSLLRARRERASGR